MRLKQAVKWAISGASRAQTSRDALHAATEAEHPVNETALHTLVIPTFRRPGDLERLITYFELAGLRSRVLISDSSPEPERTRNEDVLAASRLTIDHRVFPEDISPYRKMHEGLQAVETPFVSACADDDFIVVPGLRASLEISRHTPTAAGAHGSYFNFAHRLKRFDVSFLSQRAGQVLGESGLERLRNMMAAYDVLFYAVQRSDVAKQSFRSADRFTTTLMRELDSSCAVGLEGPVLRVATPYMGRNTAESLSYKGWHPHQILSDKPSLLFEDYAALRADLLERLEARDGLQAHHPDVLDMIFLQYLGAFLTKPVMSFIVQRRFVDGADAKETVRRLWDTFVYSNRTMHRRVPLFADDGFTFSPGVRAIRGPIVDYAHSVRHEFGETQTLFYNEFFADEGNDRHLIDRKGTETILTALTLYAIAGNGAAALEGRSREIRHTEEETGDAVAEA